MNIHNRFALLLASALILALSSVEIARAASGNWNVDADGNWSDATNWSSNPTVPGTVNTDVVGLNNNISGNRIVTIDTTSRTVGTLNIGDSDNTHGFTLAASGGGTLTINGALNETGSTADFISAPITLTSNLASSVAGSLTISGAIGQDATNRTITKTGAGTLLLSGGNTYAGNLTINGGIVRAGANAASASAGPFGNAGSSQVVLANSAGVGLDVNGFNVFVKELNGGGAAGGNVTLGGGTLTINNPAFGVFYSGIISGAGNLVVNGSSGTNLSGANTFTGTTTINNNTTLGLNNVNALGVTPGVNGTSQIIFNNTGQLRPRIDGVIINAPITVNAASTAQIQAPDNNPGAGVPTTLTLNGAIGGSGNVSFISRLNANALNTVFLGAASNYAGTTLLDTSGGTAAQIIVRLGVNNALPTTTVVTIDGQNGTGTGLGRFAEINLNGFSQQLAGLTNVSRTLRAQRVVNSDVSAAATLTISGSASSTFSGNLGGTGGSVTNTAMPGSTNGNNFGLVKDGTGTFTLSGTNTYIGGTTISNGVIQANASNVLGTGAVSVAGGARMHVNANSVTLPNNFTLNGTTSGGALLSGDRPAGNVTTLSGTITLASSSNIASWWNDKTLTLSGQITGPGNLTFDRATSLGDPVGGRFLVSNASNNYLGTTTVNGRASGLFGYTGQAMLYLGANNALPTTTTLTLNNATLYLNGFSQSLPSIGGSGTFNVQNGSTTAASLTLGAGNTTSTFAGTIQDNGLSVTNTAAAGTPVIGTVALTKIGTGTLTLTGANNYSGATTVSDGTLLVNGTHTGGAAYSVAAGATLGGSGRLTNSAITGAGLVSPGNSPGILTALAADAALGTDYLFEMTALNDPTWSNATASLNDVLRLTDATAPLTSLLDGDNTVTVNFAIPLAVGDIIRGGFYTDRNSDFTSLVNGADWQYTFTGGSLPLGASIVRSVTQVSSANFAGGTINDGWITTFQVVPEPSSMAMLAFGMISLWLFRRKKV